VGIALAVGVVAGRDRPAPVRADRRPGVEVIAPEPRAPILVERSARRFEVVRALLGGRIDLAAAAARFRALAAGDDETLGHVRRAFPDRPDDECWARSVICHARAELARRGADEAPADRLEAELARRVAAGGFPLPASPGPTPGPTRIPPAPDA
jgi:hypothetical protein